MRIVQPRPFDSPADTRVHPPGPPLDSAWAGEVSPASVKDDAGFTGRMRVSLTKEYVKVNPTTHAAQTLLVLDAPELVLS